MKLELELKLKLGWFGSPGHNTNAAVQIPPPGPSGGGGGGGGYYTELHHTQKKGKSVV